MKGEDNKRDRKNKENNMFLFDIICFRTLRAWRIQQFVGLREMNFLEVYVSGRADAKLV